MEAFSNPQDFISYQLSSKVTEGKDHDYYLKIKAVLTIPSPGGVWDPYRIEILSVVPVNTRNLIQFLSENVDRPKGMSYVEEEFGYEINGDEVTWFSPGEIQATTPYNRSFRELLREIASLDLTVQEN